MDVVSILQDSNSKAEQNRDKPEGSETSSCRLPCNRLNSLAQVKVWEREGDRQNQAPLIDTSKLAGLSRPDQNRGLEFVWEERDSYLGLDLSSWRPVRML